MSNIRTSVCFMLCVLVLSSTCLAADMSKKCKSIHVGTNTKSTGTLGDIVSNGDTNKMWTANSFSPVIVTHSKKIEYFYLVNLDIDLEETEIKLSHDNPQYANYSTMRLKKEKKDWYTIEVVYNCEAYGGALVNYKIDIDIPECGSASFVWKKVCGYPLTPRDGFTVDMTYNSSTINVVKNGIPVNDNFWDEEINDWAISIPENIDTATFDIYMNPDDIATDSTLNETDRDINSILKAFPEVEMGIPKIDSDDAVASVEIKGELVGEGGIVKKDKTQITVTFDCQNVRGYSTIEFVLPLANFRDINLFFYKDCSHVSSGLLSGLFFWIFIGLAVFLGYIIYQNYQNGKTGLNAVPFGEQASSLLQNVVKAGSSSIQKLSTPSTSKSSFHDDDESSNDFNIRNMDEIGKGEDENKYGTI